jgi:hypothetical protein
MNLKFITLFYFLCLVTILVFSCKKETTTSNPSINTDKILYDLSKSSTGFVWYKNSDVLLSKSSGTGHFQAFLRTRYNSIASSQLDATGKIKIGAIFPEGSLIVKELYENTTTLSRYAILYKKSDSPDADPKGWVWGYINANGSVADAASNKGRTCISCHSQNGNIDYMLMNKYFQ